MDLQAVKCGKLTMRQASVDKVEDVDGAPDGSPSRLCVHLSTGAKVLASRVLLATGYTTKRPGGQLVDDLITSASLPVAKCGYPVVDQGARVLCVCVCGGALLLLLLLLLLGQWLGLRL